MLKCICKQCDREFETDKIKILCDYCEKYLHDLQNEQNNINILYIYDESGFCDGFINL